MFSRREKHQQVDFVYFLREHRLSFIIEGVRSSTVLNGTFNICQFPFTLNDMKIINRQTICFCNHNGIFLLVFMFTFSFLFFSIHVLVFLSLAENDEIILLCWRLKYWVHSHKHYYCDCRIWGFFFQALFPCTGVQTCILSKNFFWYFEFFRFLGY